MEAALMPQSDSVKQFLDILLANKPDDAYVLIWTLESNDDKDEKRSYWIQEPGRIAAKIIELNKAGRHVYIGCGWTLDEYGPYARAKASQISGIPALWFDLDIAHDVHKKAKTGTLPPDVSTVVKTLKDITPEPTIVVSSGYGLHLWWVFEQPWMFDDDSDLEKARQLSKAWSKYIEGRLKRLGWDSDTTSDLSRILRPPGTFNYKIVDDPKPVEILHSTDSKYSPESLRAWLKEHDRGLLTSIIPREQLSGSGDFVLRANAQPPADRWADLLGIDVRVSEVWNKKKTSGDKSQSGHDFTLACWAIQGGFSDQETVDLLIAFRAKHKEDLKLDNHQYYERTLEKAREQQGKEFEYLEEEKDVLEKVEASDTEYARNPFTEDERTKALRILNRWVDVGEYNEESPGGESNILPALTKIICYTRDPAIYYLELRNLEGEIRRVKVGDGNDIRDQKKWSLVIWNERGHDTRKIDRNMWQKAIKLIARAMVRESPGEESTEAGMFKAWIRDYIGPDVQKVENRDDRFQQLRTMAPFIEDDKVYISMPLFSMYLRQHRGKNIDESTLPVILKSIGGKQRDFNFNLPEESRRQKKRYWEIPWVGDEAYGDIDREPDPVEEVQLKKVREHIYEEL